MQKSKAQAAKLLRHDALRAKPASVCEDDGTVLNGMFVEQDASPGIAQQPRQRGLALEEWAIAHILAVMLDVVEGQPWAGSRLGVTSSSRNRPPGYAYRQRQL